MNRLRKEKGQEDNSESNPPSPLREFTDDSQGTPPSMHLFRLEVTAYWLLPLAIFCAILFGGIYLAFKYEIFGNWSGEFERPPAYYNASGEIDVAKLFDHYLAAVGGRKTLEGIRSVRFKGRLLENTGEIPFQILISLPDKGMIITHPGEDYSQKLVLNGNTAWQAVGLGDGRQKIVPLNEANTESLAWSLRVHNTFRRHALEERKDGFAAREIQFEGRPCIELTKTLPNGADFLAVLDKKTLHLLKSVEMVPGPEGMEALESVYSDHREVSGIVEAFTTRAYKDGAQYNETILSSIELNPGLVSSLFKVPEELSK